MRSRYSLLSILFSVFLTFSSFHGVSGQVDFPAGSSFRFLRGKDATSLDAGWMNGGFNDSEWPVGNAPMRYGDGVGGTLLSGMQYNYSVVYMRTTFTANHADSLESLLLSIDYDDGFVIWINGIRVLSQFAPFTLASNAFATENHESGTPESFKLDPDIFDLVEGENILAIQGFNISLTSTDFLFDIGMKADVIVPVLNDSVGLEFSIPSGFYDTTFFLDIVPADTTWDVVYTLDGSNPQNSETSFVSEGSARIIIDPDSYDGRPLTPAVVVRASASMAGIKPAYPESRSYIFLNEVLTQTNPGGGWPSQSINEQVIDVEMDSRIVTHSGYKNQIIPALKDIPTISVVTDLDHLFNPQTGIYVNAGGHGHTWERECSVELIQPDDFDGFNVNAGLRIRGGWSRHPEFAKHAFRLFFRSGYGDAKLYFPLFGEEGVEQYDKIDLRCAQNYAWSNGDGRNTFLRDVFSRDIQRDMGQPYTRSRFYHLYMNGMYWGLFQTQERSEARFAADYFGGRSDDYDVIKVNTENWAYQIEATDGDFTQWFALWDMCNTGFKYNGDYFKLEGKDAGGKPLTGGEVHVDIDNLIDYMLSIFYTGNFDAPTSTFGWNKGPNNFFAINSRVNRSTGFTFYNHDAEHSLFSEVVDPGTGLYEDRVNLTLRTDDKHMEVGHFGSFHPQWLHHKLTANQEYRVRFMDRANLHLSGEGVLTPIKNEERLNKRATEIENAIVAESARWGDGRPWVTNPFTKDDNWVPQVQKIRSEFFPYRTDILINQLKEAGLYSSLDPPLFTNQGTVLYDRHIPVDGPTTLLIENRNDEGIICYTTDGSDPRQVGGMINVYTEISEASQLELNFQSSAVIKARIHNQGVWSALKEVYLMSGDEDFTNLSITELHYHPEEMIFEGDTISGKELEFIEFKNIGEDAINLSGLVLDSAIYYEFHADAVLAPGQFWVVASKPSAFYLRYGMVASGNFKKNLSNGGEEVLLRNLEGNPVIHFIYSDEVPWPVKADGDGYSLVSADYSPTGNPAESSYWRRSFNPGGSPFENDPFPLKNDHPSLESTDIQIYPNPTTGILNIVLAGSDTDKQAVFSLYGIKGNLIHQVDLPGTRIINLEGLNLSSGLYIVRIQTGDQVHTRKIIFR